MIHVIVYKLSVLDRNTWYKLTLFILDKNTWHLLIVQTKDYICSQVKEFDKQKCNEKLKLRRGLEFYVFTINKSAPTKKVWKLI